MVRRRAAFLLLSALVACAGIAVSGANGTTARTSLTRAQADAIAVRLLRPQADRGEVILFGLPAALRAGTLIAPADPPRGALRKVRVPARRLAGPAWLYWLDRDPYARFSHESEYLLVDDRSGKVLHRQRIGWFPSVNGREPAFLSGIGYDARRHRVFARIAAPRRVSSPARPTGPAQLLPGAFSNDCVLMVGDYGDAAMRNDFPAAQGWATSVGLRSFYATRSGPRGAPAGLPPTAKDLEANLKTLVEAERCLDVLVYMSGHGVKAADGPPTVITGKTARALPTAPFVEIEHVGVTAGDLEKAMRAHPTITFKLKIDSCFSGRFLDALSRDGKPSLENLLIVEVSSGATQTSLSRAERKGTPFPQRIGTFTRQNLVGMQTWAASEEEVKSAGALGGSLLAHALERAFTLGRSSNAGISRGKVPRLATNFLDLSLTRSSWLHPAGSTSSLTCAEVESEPGTDVNVAVSTNARRLPEPTQRTVRTGANGRAVASFRIFSAAQYAFGAAGRKGPRTARAAPIQTTVPPPPQQAPAGSVACPPP